jgi:hypothetical protein
MSEKPPCECIEKIDGHWTYRCECSNGGDAEYAASWVADENAQDEITRLTARVKELERVLSDGVFVLDDLTASRVDDEVLTSLIDEFRATLSASQPAQKAPAP